MKAVIKAFFAIGLFLVLAGGLLALSGWAMGARTQLNTPWGTVGIFGWSGMGIPETAPVVETVDTSTGSGGLEDLHLAAFDKIDVNLNLGDVTILAGDDYGIELDWTDGRYSMSYTCSGGTLKVRDSSSGIWNAWEGGGTAVIYVPEDASLEKVSLSTNLGSIYAEDLNCKKLEIDNDLGDVDLYRVEAEQMDFSLSLGDLSGDELTVTSKLHASNDLGNIWLQGDLRGNLDLDCDLGNIDFDTTAPLSEFGYDLEVSAGTLSINGEDQRSKASRSGGSSFLEADCDLGDLSVTFGA